MAGSRMGERRGRRKERRKVERGEMKNFVSFRFVSLLRTKSFFFVSKDELFNPSLYCFEASLVL